MASRCLNQVSLIGNLTRDPELKYTPSGMAVISFGLATNRSWVTRDGERKEDAQFHRIVAWNKLAELCSQLLAKGRRIFVQGRIQYREFTDAEGNRRQVPEIVISDMILLDNKRVNAGGSMGSGEMPQVSPQAKKEEVSTIDDGTIEDIVIPDELPEEKDKKDSSLSDVVDEVMKKKVEKKEEPVIEEKKEKKEDSGEEVPF